MRARNVKPGLLTNELLGPADPLLTILFVGLWMVADREGRLEDKPLKLCRLIFPYRRRVTPKRMDAMLAWLHEHKFIIRYVKTSGSWIQVVEFRKHQRPHSSEAPSIIQGLDSTDGTPRYATEAHLGMPGGALIPDSLIPDSLIPDSLIPDSREEMLREHDPHSERRKFESIRGVYPPGTYLQNDWLLAEREIGRRVEEGESWEALAAGVVRYRAQLDAKGTVGTQFVMSPKKFFGSDRIYRDPFPMPANGKKPKPAWTPPKPIEQIEAEERERAGNRKS